MALTPSLRSTFGPRGAPTSSFFLPKEVVAVVPLRRSSRCRSRSLFDGCVVGRVAPGVSRPPVVRVPVSLPGLLPKQVTLGDVDSRSRRCGVGRDLLPVSRGMRSASFEAVSASPGPSPLAGVGSGSGRSAPGPFSTDESVTFHHRCRLRNALSFHGLRSPPRSPSIRSSFAESLRVVIPFGGPSCAFVPLGSLVCCGHPTFGVVPRRGVGPSSESVRLGGCALCSNSTSVREI